MRISAVINTLNESANLPFALRSIQSWVDEIVVVDMYSDDRTVEIARDFGAKVFFHERVGFADPARAFAIEQSLGDWILVLDADEVIPRALAKQLIEITAEDSADVVKIPRLNYLLGAPMMHSLWGPAQDAHLRFFKRNHVRATATVHNYLHVVGGSRLKELAYRPGMAILHFNYLNSEHFIDKLNRYTTIEATQLFDRGEHVGIFMAILRAAWEFWRRYVLGGGWRDGWRGFYLSAFMMFYRIAAAAKCKELWQVGTSERVRELYQLEAERILLENEVGIGDVEPSRSRH
jgi:glycosyltransferase involved in cell wall biosynthesis